MSERELYTKIKNAVQSGIVNSPFGATDFSFLKVGSRNFLWKHSKENLKLKGKSYFKKISRGKYELDTNL